MIGGRDGLVRTDWNVLVMMVLGDCVGVVLCDARRGMMGNREAGWGGSVGNMVEERVKEMEGGGGSRSWI